MKPFKIVYYIFIVVIAVIALLLIISIFPITGNYKMMVVQSGSMEPAIKMGSVVIVKPTDNYKIGEIITFGEVTRTKTPTTHRIHDIRVQEGTPIYITKGDANNAPDLKEVTAREIIGKVLFNVPYVGYAVEAAKKPIGFMLIIIVPAIIIIYDEIRKVFKETKKIRQKDKDKTSNDKSSSAPADAKAMADKEATADKEETNEEKSE